MDNMKSIATGEYSLTASSQSYNTVITWNKCPKHQLPVNTSIVGIKLSHLYVNCLSSYWHPVLHVWTFLASTMGKAHKRKHMGNSVLECYQCLLCIIKKSHFWS